jgi:hypothetical protein
MSMDRAPHRPRLMPYVVGVGIIGVLWSISLLFGVVMLYEFGLPRIRAAFSTKPKPDPRHPLTRAGYYKTRRDGNPYALFHIQHLHPTYLFFFPLDLGQRAAINNEIVSITTDGFRGAGPSLDKPLAVLVGGSAAFGDKASSDQTTITGYLNRMQPAFHFVTAGVPSWNSTQELHRLADQVIPLKPKLVISYSYSNDILNALRYAQRGLVYPPGTPESFDELMKRVNDLRAPSTLTLRRYVSSFFPRTIKKLRHLRGTPSPRQASDAEILAAVENAADKFVANQTVMRYIADGGNFRFVTVLQPSLRTHKNSPERYRAKEWWLFTHAVNRIMASEHCRRHCLNYSDLFDKEFAEIPTYSEVEAMRDFRSIYFADVTHLLDAGNEYVARRLVQDLKLHPLSTAPARR